MKKQSAYWRKREREGVIRIDPQIWAKAIHNCTPHDEVAPLPVPVVTATAADRVRSVQGAFAALQAGMGAGHEFNILATEIGKASVRAVDIAGPNRLVNPMIDILRAGNEALRRVIRRFDKWGKWQLDGADVVALTEAVELYETILQSSSPAQMNHALAKRETALNLGKRDAKRQAQKKPQA